MPSVRGSAHLTLLALLFAPPCWSQNPSLIAAVNTKAVSGPDASLSANSPVEGPSTTPAPDAASLFDSVGDQFSPLVTNIEVRSTEHDLETVQGDSFQAGGQEITGSAGTFGDISRFLQTFPGVVATGDLSNEVLVRGGHPMENLFLVDGIEVPNINHLATAGTTGGFGPMIDSGLVQGIKMFTGGYDAQFPERLSSVTEIETLDPKHLANHVEGDLGIQGVGGLVEKSIHGSDLLTSAHHGLLSFMKDAGIDGLPAYTNALARLRHNDGSGNRLTILHLAGWDSVDVDPCPLDSEETSAIDSQYSGWRTTTGAEWQHVYSPTSFAVASVSDSEEVEHIHQQDQTIVSSLAPVMSSSCQTPMVLSQPTPVYMEDSNAAFSNASYRYEWTGPAVSMIAGSATWLQRPHYTVQQPLGAFSPYSAAPVRADSTSFRSSFSTGETGSFAEFTLHPLRSLALSAGGRIQTFAFGDHITFTPRLSLRYFLGEHAGLHIALARYAQLPPYIYLESYPSNRSLAPMRSTHEIIGLDLDAFTSSAIHIEAYHKAYSALPASTEYPSVDLHDMVDMLGQQFVWLPMNSDARGSASGIEISDLTRIRSHLVLRGSIAYSRAMFAAMDRISRPSNFDFPWIVNVEALQRFSRGYEIASRYAYATGRPYTPFDAPDSLAQDRPIYDVSQMNALRVPAYGRLDSQLNKEMKIRGLHLELYMGVENILNRNNFLAYVWLPQMEQRSRKPVNESNMPVKELDQMPIFPNFGVRYIFQ
ncbi:MAG TPA: TonB-dependent receptor [Terracidiphilus sp.]|jgi:hypothetical protein|nr:TonB-dependent receptor [Terracidiphilus sp.]